MLVAKTSLLFSYFPSTGTYGAVQAFTRTVPAFSLAALRLGAISITEVLNAHAQLLAPVSGQKSRASN